MPTPAQLPVYTETWLVQVWSEREDRWMDYCRGTEAEARQFLAGKNTAEWRCVDWIKKDQVLIG